MPGLTFQRFDLSITARRQRSGEVRLTVASPAGVQEWVAPRSTVQDWYASSFLLGDDLRERFGPPADWMPASKDETLIKRVTVDADHVRLASLGWEEALEKAAWTDARSVVVRISPARARVLSIPLTLPLRIAIADAVIPVTIAANIFAVFGSHRTPEELEPTIRVAECAHADLDSLLRKHVWPTVEVLHLDEFAPAEDETLLLSTERPNVFPTAGWFLRRADLWQTRLVVLCCASRDGLPWARRLAHTLASRGGPAVLVTPPSDPNFFQAFYDRLIHDDPLDQVLQIANQNHPDAADRALFAGGGREEILRVSSIGEQLLSLSQELESETDWMQRQIDAPELEPPRSQTTLEMLSLIRRNLPRVHALAPVVGLLNTTNTMRNLQSSWPDFTFNYRESDGLLPLSFELVNIRQQAGVPDQPQPRAPGVGESPDVALRQPGPRFVNSRFWQEAAGGRLAAVEQSSRLQVGRIYHLGIQIGPQDRTIRVIGAVGLLEEVFKWTDDQEGVWVEFGVAGIDFDVLGSPVQEVWLPRHSPTDTIYFAVVPRREGASLLRFCLYFQHNVIQSFRLAAVTGGPPGNVESGNAESGDAEKAIRERAYSLWQAAGEPGGRDWEFWFQAENAHTLSSALDVSPADAEGVGYLPRLEFALSDLDQAPAEREGQTVSIVANRIAGRSATALKGPDVFVAETDSKLSVHVDDFRTVLDAIASKDLTEVEARALGRKKSYNFGADGDPNRGNAQHFETSLKDLAVIGWRIFSDLIPTDDDQRERLTKLLKQGCNIQVAHVFLEKVIPWAGVYDRLYDADKQEIDEQPADHKVCLACLPDDEGKMPSDPCGKHADCLLHPDRLQARQQAGEPAISSETVVCPFHFWGFRNSIEVPPHSVDDPSKPEAKEFREILNGPGAHIVSGFHQGLELQQDHATALVDLFNRLGAATWDRADQRDRLLKLLKSTDVDVIYFFCHAREKTTTSDDVLEFWDGRLDGNQNPVLGRISSSQLDTKPPWDHHPLVILNGCQTVGFTSEAVSPFVKTLVRRRKAAGVLGTEVPVWEQLASEVALRFLEEFLTGTTAGESLLTVRRRLLSKLNPLGLLYTLYAFGGLKLRSPYPRAQIAAKGKDDSPGARRTVRIEPVDPSAER